MMKTLKVSPQPEDSGNISTVTNGGQVSFTILNNSRRASVVDKLQTLSSYHRSNIRSMVTSILSFISLLSKVVKTFMFC